MKFFELPHNAQDAEATYYSGAGQVSAPSYGFNNRFVPATSSSVVLSLPELRNLNIPSVLLEGLLFIISIIGLNLIIN